MSQFSIDAALDGGAIAGLELLGEDLSTGGDD